MKNKSDLQLQELAHSAYRSVLDEGLAGFDGEVAAAIVEYIDENAGWPLSTKERAAAVHHAFDLYCAEMVRIGAVMVNEVDVDVDEEADEVGSEEP